MRRRDTRPYRPYGGRKKHRALTALLCVVLLLAILFTSLEFYIGFNSRTQITGEPQVMVIFGCQVMSWGPSVLLRDRLDAALDYLEDHPDMTVIVTGGKGDDEHQSEADCMYDYLTAHGFSGTILREDRARNTWQNVNNTRALLTASDMPIVGDGSILLVSSGFHLSRIRMLWQRAGGSAGVSTLAAPVTHRPSAVKMFFREPLALVKSFLTDH